MFLIEIIVFVIKGIAIGSIAGLILVIIISAISASKRTKSKSQPSTYNAPTYEIRSSTSASSINSPTESLKINVSAEFTSTSSQDDEPVGELTYIDLGKPKEKLGCYLNYNNYRVIGIDEDGKSKLRLRTGVNEQQAIRKAESAGLHAPFKVAISEYDPPTERQLSYLKNLGVVIPDFITKDDASCMISRVVDNDMKNPNPKIVELALALNTNFSAFIGARELFFSIIAQASDRDRAALYAYGVHQNIKRTDWTNMMNDPDLDKFYSFADFINTDSSLLKSLKGREPSDFMHPHKGTKIYKATISFFNLD